MRSKVLRIGYPGTDLFSDCNLCGTRVSLHDSGVCLLAGNQTCSRVTLGVARFSRVTLGVARFSRVTLEV